MDGLVMLVNKKESYLKQQLDQDVKQIEVQKLCLETHNYDQHVEMVGVPELTKKRLKLVILERQKKEQVQELEKIMITLKSNQK